MYFYREDVNKSIFDTVSTTFGKCRIFLPEARQNAREILPFQREGSFLDLPLHLSDSYILKSHGNCPLSSLGKQFWNKNQSVSVKKFLGAVYERYSIAYISRNTWWGNLGDRSTHISSSWRDLKGQLMCYVFCMLKLSVIQSMCFVAFHK